MIQTVTDETFDRVVEAAPVPVLIECWQPGCGHGRALLGELERVQAEVGDRLLILTMNVEENFQVPAELEISSRPALALYRQGQFDRFIGGIGTQAEILGQLGFAVSG